MSAEDTDVATPSPSPSSTPGQRAHSGLYIGTVRGIRFYLDYSWFLIAALLVYSLSRAVFPQFLPGKEPAVYLAMGGVAAALFFLSILLHEMGHSVVSQRCGIPVPSITLLFIGGIAEISREPEDARSELKIAVAGPAVSLLLVACYLGLSWLFAWGQIPEGRLVFRWLASVNLWLVIFNAVPGYPLDGGRVLRALLWMRNGKLRQATLITSRIGIGFSWLLMGIGVLGIISGAWSAIVFVLIGLFLKTAAAAGYSQTLYQEILNGVRVRDLMTPAPVAIPAALPLHRAVDDYFLTHHHVAFPVVDEAGGFCGLLRLEFLKTVPRDQWPQLSAGALAEQYATRTMRVAEGVSAAKAFRTLMTSGQGRLGVTREGTDVLVGIITRHDLLHYIRIHAELEPEGSPSQS
jgi:Zn-dependent protease